MPEVTGNQEPIKERAEFQGPEPMLTFPTGLSISLGSDKQATKSVCVLQEM